MALLFLARFQVQVRARAVALYNGADLADQKQKTL